MLFYNEMKIIIMGIVILGLTRFFQWLVNGGLLCILWGRSAPLVTLLPAPTESIFGGQLPATSPSGVRLVEAHSLLSTQECLQ